MAGLDLSWLGGGVGGMLRGGRDTNAGGSAYGGKRTLGKDFLEGVGTATDEQFASDAKKARSLRTYLAEIDPTLKERVQAMGLEGLEGHAMSLAEKKLAARQKLNEDYMRQQMAAMQSAADERTRDATATQEFGKAMQPPLSGSDYMGQFLDPAAPVNMNVQQANPLQAYFAAVAKSGGGAPDLRGLNALAQFAPQENSQPQRGAPQLTQLGGVDVFYNPYTGVFEQSALSRAKASEDVQRNVIGARADARGAAGYPAGSKVITDENDVLILVGPDGTILKTLGQKRAPGMAEVVAGMTGGTNAPAPAKAEPSMLDKFNAWKKGK